ncbi:MAG: zinc-ribbon domain-containing protein [Deltaproteobacteria bacterium]|nr:zinc-ribbon domain-containing protein [Deltaproteobacteria bacterium]
MEIQCEECRTIFSVDKGLIKEDGSKVRCSICGHTFLAFPERDAPIPGETDAAVPPVEPEIDADTDDELVPLFDEDLESEFRETEEPLESGPFRADRDSFQVAAGKTEAEETGISKARQGFAEDGLDGDEALAYDPDADLLAPDEEDRLGEGGEAPAAEMDYVRIEKRSSKWRFAIFPLVILLVLLVGAVVAVNYWKPEVLPPPVRSFVDSSISALLKTHETKEPVDPGVRLLELSSVSGSFVDSEKAGRLFVIRGLVLNRYAKPRSHILIKGDILDDKGQVVKTGQAYAGNTFTDEEIRILSLEEIRKAANNPDGAARKNFNLPSGEAISFMIVFDRLPDNLSEFTVEAISSSSGS